MAQTIGTNLLRYLGMIGGSGANTGLLVPRASSQIANQQLFRDFEDAGAVADPDIRTKYSSAMRRAATLDAQLQLWDEMAEWDLMHAALVEVVDEATAVDANSPGSIWFQCNDRKFEDELNSLLVKLDAETIIRSQVWHVAALGNHFEKLEYAPSEGVLGMSFVHPMEMRRYWLERNRKCIGFKWAGHRPDKEPVFVGPDNQTPVERVALSTGKDLEQLYYPWDFCAAGDTKISLLDGREISLEDLQKEVGEGEFWVYSSTASGRIVPGRAHSLRLTRKAAKVVEIELDNGEKVRFTPDHKFMLRDGTYREAGSLAPGDSLMPLYRKLSTTEEHDRKGYEMFLDNDTNRWRFTRKAISRETAIKINQRRAVDPEFNSRVRAAQQQNMRRLQEHIASGEVKLNHKVVAVREAGVSDVYDFEVDDWHNFALSAGVFVHNCHMRRLYRLRVSEHGEPIFAEAEGIYKKLRIAVDQMVIHRAQVQPDRYSINIDVQEQPPVEQMRTAQRWKQQLRAKLAFGQTGQVGALNNATDFSSYYNAWALDTVLYVAQPKGFTHTVTKVGGTTQIPDVYDIELLTDLFYSIIGMPRSWFGGQKDQTTSPSGKALLAQDIRFLRKIKSIRSPITQAYIWLGYFHAVLRGMNIAELDIKALMPPIGSLEDQMKLEMLKMQTEILDQLADVMSKYRLPKEAWIETIFKRYLHLPDDVVNLFITALPAPTEGADAMQGEALRDASPTKLIKIFEEEQAHNPRLRYAVSKLLENRHANEQRSTLRRYRKRTDVMETQILRKSEVVVSSVGRHVLESKQSGNVGGGLLTEQIQDKVQAGIVNETEHGEPAYRRWMPSRF